MEKIMATALREVFKRDVLFRFYVEKKSKTQIALELECSRNTVKKYINESPENPFEVESTAGKLEMKVYEETGVPPLRILQLSINEAIEAGDASLHQIDLLKMAMDQINYLGITSQMDLLNIEIAFEHGLKSKAEALRAEKRLAIELDRKFLTVQEPTWEIHLERFYVELANRDISKKTVENMAVCLKAHTLEIWKDRLLSEITTQDVRHLILSKETLSESHKKNILKYIRGAFEYAVDTRILKSNPTPKMAFRIGDKLKAVLTVEQINTLLTYAKNENHEWYYVWVMACYTGLRNGELYALTWDKINLETRMAIIDSSWNSKDGFKDTKSGDDRVISLAPELVNVLKELKLKSYDSHFVFPRIDRWDKGEQARELRRTLEGLGLPRVRFHDLRATWATIMLSKGIPAIKVMSMGGWKDLKTMQFYIRKAGVDISGISDKLVLHDSSRLNNVLEMY